MRYGKDYKRLVAKIMYKIRRYYISGFQEKVRHLSYYPSYRHRKRQNSISLAEHNPLYLTKLVNPSAGIGDQLASWISGFYYAKKYGLNYAFSPVYPQKWNDFLGLEIGEENTVDLIKKHGYRKVWLPYFDEKDLEDDLLIKQIIQSYRGKKVVFFLELHHVYGEQYGVMTELKEKFEMSPNRKTDQLIYCQDDVNIAVHIRRGDITAGRTNGNENLSMRWLDNEYYDKILTVLTQALKTRKIHIYVFSQGEEKEFLAFKKYSPITFCNEMSAMDSFLHFVRADILVTSKSSFSYKPALIADGIRICPQNFWHGYPKDSNWILVDDEGNFNDQILKKAFQDQSWGAK